MNGDATSVRVMLELSQDEAWAFAQFLKRSTFTDYRGCAVSDEEARVMIDACEVIRRALADVGYAPR